MYSSNRTNYSSVHQPNPMDDETENIYGIRLTPAVYYELIEYFNLNENLGLRQSDVIAKLLHAAKELSAIRSNQTTTSSFGLPTLKLHQPLPSSLAVFTAPASKRKAIDIGNRPVINLDQDEESDEEQSSEDEVVEEETFYGDDDYNFEKEDDEPIGHGLTASSAAASITSGNVSSNYYSNVKKRLTPAVKKKTKKLDGYRKRSSTAVQRQSDKIRLNLNLATRQPKSGTSNLRRLIYDLILRRRRDHLLHCNECNHWIPIAFRTCGLRYNNLLDHVCRHYGKSIMYSCRLCQHQTMTRTQIQRHLKLVHQKIKDFDDLTDNYYQELSERIRQCFDHEAPEQSSDRQIGICKKKERSLHQFLNKETPTVRQFVCLIMEKWQKESNIYCRHCNRWIRLGNSDSQWTQTQVMLNHICVHFNLSLQRCKICDERTTTYSKMAIHLRNVHQTTPRGNCVDDFDNYEVDLKNFATQCFDWEEGTGPPEWTVIDSTRNENATRKKRLKKGASEQLGNNAPFDRIALLRFIFSIIEKWRSGNAIYCRHCNCWIRLHGNTSNAAEQTRVVFDHLCYYNNIQVYRCLICQERLRASHQLLTHSRNVHQTVSRGNFVEEIDGHETNLRELTTKYFDWEEGTGPPASTENGPYLKSISRRLRHQPLKYRKRKKKKDACRFEILERASRLIDQFFSNTTIIKCRQCDKDVHLKTGGPSRRRRPEALLNHALIHIEGYAYACRLCNETKKIRKNMRRHVQISHQDIDRYDFIDQMEEIKEQILDMMKKCFDLNFEVNGANENEATTNAISVNIN